MPNVRRLYLYAVTFISLEVVIWASISLLRSITTREGTGGGFDKLAGALSLVLVGAPIFLIHWGLLQRSARQDIDERSSRVWAVFIYLTLLVTLVPVTQGIFALLNHWMLNILGLPVFAAMSRGVQAPSDYWIAIAVNLSAAAYFYYILRLDWRFGQPGVPSLEVRRLYRYFWLLFSLLMAVFGIQQVLQFALEVWDAPQGVAQSFLANGLALLIVGLPLWLFTEWLIQRSLADSNERNSILRLVVLYLVVFLSALSVLISIALVLYQVLYFVLGEPVKLIGFLINIAVPLSLAVPLGLSWIYYGHCLKQEITSKPSAATSQETIPLVVVEADRQRRAGLRRLYGYVLALLGLAATFIGVQLLLSFILDMAFSSAGLLALRNRLAAAMAALIVGLPLWLMTWRPLAVEAAQEGEMGDHARRSLVRKSYLYLALFTGVMGIMFGTGILFYQVIRALLGNPVVNFSLRVLIPLKTVLLFVTLFIFHWQTLRADGRMAERSLSRRFAQYPVLVLAPDDSDFGEVVAQSLQHNAPGIPVAVHPINQGAPDESLSAARVVILPAEVVARPSEALRLWLQGYQGNRLVLPTPTKDWFWLGIGSRSLSTLARQASQITRQLAEGQEITPDREVSPTMILAFVVVGLFILLIILIGLASGINLLAD